MLLRTDDFLGEFRILEVIGDGGFSVVYKAEDTQLERLVAIKQLNPDAFTEFGTEQRFIREAKLAASLNHPNIVSIYTFKQQNDSSLKVITDDVSLSRARLRLVQAAKIALARVLDLMGMDAPDRM